MRISQEETQKRFKQLPESLREAIFSAEITETLIAIGKKYGLGLDKVGDLSTETNLVMLGVTHPNQYISSLQQTLGIERDVARNIAQEVNTQVFAKIREELRKLHDIKDEEKTETPQSAAIQAPAIQEKPIQKEIPKVILPPKPTMPVTPVESYAHKDLSPLPETVRKPYTFAELQKKSETKEIEKKELPAIILPPKENAPHTQPPLLAKMPAMPIQETAPKPVVLAPNAAPKTPSPFEAKIKESVFRQEPAESIKEGKNTPAQDQSRPSSDASDPYRQPIAPEEASFTINPRITKDE